jgi:hypothetical protein
VRAGLGIIDGAGPFFGPRDLDLHRRDALLLGLSSPLALLSRLRRDGAGKCLHVLPLLRPAAASARGHPRAAVTASASGVVRRARAASHFACRPSAGAGASSSSIVAFPIP